MVDPELVAIGAEAPARLTGLRVDVAVAAPDFGGLRAASSQPAGNLESII
jgi:hypothetical protein